MFIEVQHYSCAFVSKDAHSFTVKKQRDTRRAQSSHLFIWPLKCSTTICKIFRQSCRRFGSSRTNPALSHPPAVRRAQQLQNCHCSCFLKNINQCAKGSLSSALNAWRELETLALAQRSALAWVITHAAEEITLCE